MAKRNGEKQLFSMSRGDTVVQRASTSSLVNGSIGALVNAHVGIMEKPFRVFNFGRFNRSCEIKVWRRAIDSYGFSCRLHPRVHVDLTYTGRIVTAFWKQKNKPWEALYELQKNI